MFLHAQPIPYRRKQIAKRQEAIQTINRAYQILTQPMLLTQRLLHTRRIE